MPFEVQHGVDFNESTPPASTLAPLIQEWCQTGADLIEAMGSPKRVLQAFERLQKALMGQ